MDYQVVLSPSPPALTYFNSWNYLRKFAHLPGSVKRSLAKLDLAAISWILDSHVPGTYF